MKVIAVILIMVGTGLAAAFGAQNPDPVRDKQITVGTAALLASQTAAAKDGYCADPADDAQVLARQRTDGCEFEGDKPPAAAAEVTALRGAWQDLQAKLGPAQAKAEALAGVNEPAGDRLSGWFDKAGLMFILGLALIIAGGVLARRAIRAEAAAMAAPLEGSAKKPKFIDFGAALDGARERLDALAKAMADNPAPTVEQLAEQLKAIELLQDEAIIPMAEARPQLIARYGMGGFAEVFGPFSGGERYVNRAWVALVDHHWEECRRSLETASVRMGITREALDKVVAAARNAA